MGKLEAAMICSNADASETLDGVDIDLPMEKSRGYPGKLDETLSTAKNNLPELTYKDSHAQELNALPYVDVTGMQVQPADGVVKGDADPYECAPSTLSWLQGEHPFKKEPHKGRHEREDKSIDAGLAATSTMAEMLDIPYVQQMIAAGKVGYDLSKGDYGKAVLHGLEGIPVLGPILDAGELLF